MKFKNASEIAKHPDGIVWLEKAEGGQVTLDDIGDALEEFGRLFKAGIASSAEILTLSRAYPNDMTFQKAAMGLDDAEPMVIGGPASVELIDREGHLITTNALKKAFKKFMENFRTRNAMVLHSDVQVGWALPAYITKGGQIFKSGVDDKGLFFICEVRGDTKIAKKVEEQINEGRLKSYSIAGSATKVENMQKGLMPYMQVDEMELAEVTVCEKGVNQGANFELLKAEVPQTGKVNKDQCGYRDASHAEEMMGENCGHCKYFNPHEKTCDLVTGDIQPGDWCSLFAPCEPEHKKVIIVMDKPDKVNFKKSFDNWLEKTETNKDPLKAKESFATLQNVAGREQVHEAFLQEMGFPAKKDVEDAEQMRYTPVVETEVDDDGKPIRVRPPWVVNEAGQELGDKHDEDSPNYSSSTQAKNRNTAGAVAKMVSLFKDMQSFPGKDRKTTPQQKPASGKKGMNMAEHSKGKGDAQDAREENIITALTRGMRGTPAPNEVAGVDDKEATKVRQLLNRQIQGADDIPVVKPGSGLKPEKREVAEGITVQESGKAPFSPLTTGEDEPDPRLRERDTFGRDERRGYVKSGKPQKPDYRGGRTHVTGGARESQKVRNRPTSIRLAEGLEKGGLTDKLKGIFGGKKKATEFDGNKTMNPGGGIGRKLPGESVAEHAKRTGIDTAAGYMRAINVSPIVDASHMDATKDMDKAEGVDKRTGNQRWSGMRGQADAPHLAGPIRRGRLDAAGKPIMEATKKRKVTPKQSSPAAKPRPEGDAKNTTAAAVERLKAGRAEREALIKPAASQPKQMPKQQRRGFNMSLEDTLIKMMKSGSNEIDVEKGIGDAVRGARNKLGAAIGGKKAPGAAGTASRDVARNVAAGRGDAEVNPSVDASMKNQPHMQRRDWQQGPTQADLSGPQAGSYTPSQQAAGPQNKGSLRERVGGFIGASMEKEGEVPPMPSIRNDPSEGEAMGRRRTPRQSGGQGKPFAGGRKDKQPRNQRKDMLKQITKMQKTLAKMMER